MPNFGLLQAIQPPQQIATLPSVAPRSDNILGGIMQGLDQGQAMQARALQMEQTRQQMDQSRQLFPGQQQIQQQTIQQNQMMNQQKAQEMQDQADLRQAAQAGPDVYLNHLQKIDPNAAVQYQANQMQYQNAILQNKSSTIDLNKKERDKADRDNAINVAVMNQVSQMPPQLADQEYQKYRADLIKKYPDIVMPEKFDADSFASVMRTNQVMQAQVSEQATDKVATLTQLQKQRDNLETNRKQLKDTGRPTDEIDRKISEVNQLINTHIKNTQTVDNQGADLAAKLNDVDIATLKTLHTASDSAPSIASATDKALEILDRPGMTQKIGPIIDITKINQLSPDVQELGSVLNQLALVAKAMNNMPSNTFSEADRNFVAKIAGTTSFNMSSLKSTLTRMNTLAKQATELTYKTEDKIRSRAPGYEEWKKTNPGPDLSPWESKAPKSNIPDGRVMVKDKNGNVGHIPKEQLDEAIKAGYTQVGQ